MTSPSALQREYKIEIEDDIISIRQEVRELAQKNGFEPFAVAALTTAASELSRNVWTHAKGGVAKIQLLRDKDRTGIELIFEDHGPGIADLDRVLAGGYSTVKSLGLGLSGSKRLVDEFLIDTAVGRGTKITLRKWKRKF